jgi:hypothetical protein
MAGINKLLMVVALSALASQASAITIDLVPDRASVPVGGRVTLEIVAADFADDEFVSAYDFSLAFEPGLLRFVRGSFVVGSALGDVADVDYFDFSDFESADLGELLPFVVSLLDDADLAARQSGPSVVLGSLEFIAGRVAAPTAVTVSPTCASVSGPIGADGNAVLLDIERCGAAQWIIEAVAVRESGTFALLVAGLLFVGAGLRVRPRAHAWH